MILTKDAIRSISHGTVFFEDGPSGGIIPRRFSQAQLDAYAYHEAFTVRTRAASGCCLEFETDAREMAVRFRCFAGSKHDLYGFDLTLDGRLLAHHEGRISEKSEDAWRVSLPNGTKYLKLHLPCLTGVEIIGIDLPGAAFCRPVRHARRILFMGDSITMGYVAHFPSGTYPARVAEAMDAEYLNQAIGGETFHPEILDENLGWTPSLIVLSYGTNDWAQKDKSSFAEDTSEFIRRITGIWPGIPVVMLTPIWRTDHLTRRNDDFLFSDIRRIMAEIAAAYPCVHVISGENFIPHVHELLADHVHPNDLGFVYYAESLIQQLMALDLF